MKNILNTYYKIKANLRYTNQVYREYCNQLNNQVSNIRFFNWWPEDFKTLWFYKFVKTRGILKSEDQVLSFCSVFGDRNLFNHIEGPKVFFTGENTHRFMYSKYADYMLSENSFDLSLGFDIFEDERYIRFPLWITYIIPPQSNYEDIQKICRELSHPKYEKRSRFASLIGRFDEKGIRAEIYNSLKEISEISCPSLLFHNDDTLQNEYMDDKIIYNKQFMFNICPENTNSYGYVTEKLFESISSGCIPIYTGSYNKPELEVLNQKAILFWNFQGNNEKTVNTIENLWKHPNKYKEFMAMPRLVDGAEDYIYGKMEHLEKSLHDLFR